MFGLLSVLTRCGFGCNTGTVYWRGPIRDVMWEGLDEKSAQVPKHAKRAMKKAKNALFHVARRVESLSRVDTIMRENFPESFRSRSSARMCSIHCAAADHASVVPLFQGSKSFLYVRTRCASLGIVFENARCVPYHTMYQVDVYCVFSHNNVLYMFGVIALLFFKLIMRYTAWSLLDHICYVPCRGNIKLQLFVKQGTDVHGVVKGKVGGDTGLRYTKCQLWGKAAVEFETKDVVAEGIATPCPDFLLLPVVAHALAAARADGEYAYLRLFEPRAGLLIPTNTVVEDDATSEEEEDGDVDSKTM